MIILDKEQHFNPTIYEEINAQYSLTFNTLVANNYTKTDIFDVEGDYFQVARVTSSRDSSVSKTIYCEHVSYQLNDLEVPFEDIEGDAASIMSALLQGTPFIMGGGIGGEYIYFKPSADNIRAALIELAKHVGGELVFHKYTISMVYQRGTNNGLEFKLGLNLKGVSEEIDYTEIPARKAYELDVLDLGHLEEYEELATAHIGDTVRIIDEQLGISDTLRIVSYEYNVYQKVLARVQIGNVLREIQDYRQEIDDTQKQLLDLWALIGPIETFKIGNENMLNYGSDETANVKALIKGSIEKFEASGVFEAKENLKGIFFKLYEKFKEHYVTLIKCITNKNDVVTFTKETWNKSENLENVLVPETNKKASYIFVVTKIPYNQLTQQNIDDEYIRAFGVTVKPYKKDDDDEDGQGGYFVEFETVTATAGGAQFDFTESYNRIVSITVGLGYVEQEEPVTAHWKPIAEGEEVTGVLVDVKGLIDAEIDVSIQAVCFREPENEEGAEGGVVNG